MFYCCGFSVRRSNFFLFLVCLSFSFIFIILVLEISYHVMVRVRVHNLVVGLFMRIWWPIGINFKIFSKTLNLCLELEVRFPIAIQRFKIMQPNIALICHSFFFFFFFLFFWFLLLFEGSFGFDYAQVGMLCSWLLEFCSWYGHVAHESYVWNWKCCDSVVRVEGFGVIYLWYYCFITCNCWV